MVVILDGFFGVKSEVVVGEIVDVGVFNAEFDVNGGVREGCGGGIELEGEEIHGRGEFGHRFECGDGVICG